jgi:xylulokinase/glycerol kinase
MNILVIDVGTSSMRGIIYTQNAHELKKLQIKYCPQYRSEFLTEQNPEEWKNALVHICKNIVQDDKQSCPIDAISITSQRSSVIPLSGTGDPIGPAIMWQDKRTMELCHSLTECRDVILKKSGSRINPIYSASKMSWIHKNQPKLYENAHKLVVVSDYLIFVMTNQLVTDHTYGSRSLLMNIKTREWDEELLRIWDIDREKLCDLIKPGQVAGGISQEFSRLTGIKEGIPVISAGGDQQCSALGQGVLRQGNTQITAGTGAYILSAFDALPEEQTSSLIIGASAIPDRYIYECSIPACCSAFNWYHNCFYLPADTDFEMINHEIVSARPTGKGPVVLPYFQGRATPDWNSRSTASFHNITLSTERKDLARALLEGICFEIKANLEVIKAHLPSINRIVLSGGLTKCAAFTPMLSGVLDLPVILSDNAESTAVGAWIAAAVSLKLFTDYEAAYKTARVTDSIQVFYPEHSSEYHAGYQEFQELYQKLYAHP